MPDIQSCIDHIKTAVDVDPWAADMAEKALKKEIPQKWVRITRLNWKCPTCGQVIGRKEYLLCKRCFSCGQRCEGVDKNEHE